VAPRGQLQERPGNGPAAILAARVGNVEFAAAITDWLTATLLDSESGLARDGVRLNPDGSIRTIESMTYTYCQGVYLGACLELAERDGHQRWAERAAAVLNAIAARIAGPDGVLPGFDDGGDGGLFNGILARYLADAAVRRPELAPVAVGLVLASADAAWRGRADVAGGPVFAHDWRRSAREPRLGVPEAGLSVQLSAWMLLEAAAVAAQVA
jgi:predicted alpha-1,6-mannanase (GH76 family)